MPRFFALARDAGVSRAQLVGSFYPQVAPELIHSSPYVRLRHLADEKVRALATPAFNVCSVNAPFVVVSVPGLRIEMFEVYTRYAEGKLAEQPVAATSSRPSRFRKPYGARCSAVNRARPILSAMRT